MYITTHHPQNFIQHQLPIKIKIMKRMTTKDKTKYEMHYPPPMYFVLKKPLVI